MSPTQSSPFSRPPSNPYRKGCCCCPVGSWAGPKGSFTNPQDQPGSRHGRGPGIPFQAATASASPSRAVTLLFSPFVGSARCHSGMLQAERRGSSARSTTRPYSYPVRLAGSCLPRDHDAQFGRCDVPGGGTHLRERCRGPRRTIPLHGHTPCPGSPEAPSGRPGVRMSRFPPLRPATGRRPPAPARRWRNATAPPAACAPAPRSPASANARRGR